MHAHHPLPRIALFCIKTTGFLRSSFDGHQGTCTRRRAVTSLSSALRLEPLASRSARLLSCRSMSRGYTTSPTQNPHDASLSSILASHLQQGNLQSMDARQPEYPQSGLSSPYAPYNGHLSEGSSADQASAVQYTPGQDYKSSTFSSSATPNSEYALPPQSARSSSGAFPDYVRSAYPDSAAGRYQAPAHSGNAMAHTSSPSISMPPDGQQSNGQPNNNRNSDGDVPIDPSIAQSSPTYPPTQHYSPYPPQHEMPQYPGQPMTQNRPEWAGYYQQPPMGYSHSPATTGGAAPNMVAHVPRPPPAVGSAVPAPYPYAHPNSYQGGHPLSTVYSFVPIPGAQQHKRPRRRYEEIERMYKCGWNGCEKAYGTLNHLNAHVTMQSHGPKRTPEGEWMIVQWFSSASRACRCPKFRGARSIVAVGANFLHSLYPSSAFSIFSPCIPADEYHRVQGNPQGVEGEEEGGRKCAETRRGASAPRGCSARPGPGSAAANASAIRPAAHDASDGWSSASAHRLSACRRSACSVPAAAGGRRAAVRD